MRLLDFSPIDLITFRDPLASVSYGIALSERGPAYTLVDENNIVLCGGIARDPQGQGWLWTFIKPTTRFLTVHGYVKRFLEVHPEPLTATAAQNGQGCRWLQTLGFTRAESLAGFYPGCPDQFVYRRG